MKYFTIAEAVKAYKEAKLNRQNIYNHIKRNKLTINDKDIKSVNGKRLFSEELILQIIEAKQKPNVKAVVKENVKSSVNVKAEASTALHSNEVLKAYEKQIQSLEGQLKEKNVLLHKVIDNHTAETSKLLKQIDNQQDLINKLREEKNSLIHLNITAAAEAKELAVTSAANHKAQNEEVKSANGVTQLLLFVALAVISIAIALYFTSK